MFHKLTPGIFRLRGYDHLRRGRFEFAAQGRKGVRHPLPCRFGFNFASGRGAPGFNGKNNLHFRLTPPLHELKMKAPGYRQSEAKITDNVSKSQRPIHAWKPVRCTPGAFVLRKMK
jgi:hypothetical protein